MDTQTIGDNKATEYELLCQEVENAVAEANRALNAVKEIADEETAERFDGFETKLASILKAVDGQRKIEKDPHDKAAAAVQARYRPLLDRLDTAKKLVKALTTKWLIKKDALLKADAARKEQEALDAIAAAEKAAAEAEHGEGDVVGNTLRAEQAQDLATHLAVEADRAAAAKPQIKSALSARARSLRTTWKGTICDQDAVYRFFRDDLAVLELLQRLTNQHIRNCERDDQGRPVLAVSGVSLVEEKVAA